MSGKIMKKRIAIIGSQGVPPRYGGFETLVDNILEHSDSRVEYTVFCSSKDMESILQDYKGARLRYVPISSHGAQSIAYDIFSMLKAIRGYDAILVLGVSGGIFLPIFKFISKTKIIVNIDGLEHLREKWGKFARRFLKKSLEICLRSADVIVSDNKGIRDYVQATYGIRPKLIAYGGDHALRNIEVDREVEILESYGLKPREYDLSICRIEPENNCEITLDAYCESQRKLVIVGNWRHNDYSKDLYARYAWRKNYHLLDAIFDVDELYVLRKNARLYIHGHKAGGTNPSLVETMFFDIPILAYDVVYNRETTFNMAEYFTDSTRLSYLIESEIAFNPLLKEKALKEYKWSSIAASYEKLF